MEPQMMQPEMAPEEMGRGTDTVLAHLSLGEVVIPRAFLDDPQVMEMLQALFEQGGANIAEFTVGDPANKINPETGYPEFFKKFFKKVSNFVLPNLGAAGGFANSLIQGEGLGGALKGAATSGLQTAASLLLPQVGSSIANSLGDVFGSLGDKALPSGVQGAVRPGSGILGSIGKATGLTNQSIPSLGGLVGGVSGGGSSFNPINAAANAFGAYNEDKSLKKQQQQLLDANRSQLANLETFDPSNITNDAGYQFNLEQGQKGLNQGLAAGGSLFSGKALKAASEYNQQYANNAFDSAYNRWLQKTQGQNALIGSSGDIRANATGARSQNLAQSLSNALGAPVGAYGQNSQLELLKRLGLA